MCNSNNKVYMVQLILMLYVILENPPLSSVCCRSSQLRHWTDPDLTCHLKAEHWQDKRIQRTPGRNIRRTVSVLSYFHLFHLIIYVCNKCYLEVSGDRWLLNSVEGTLWWRAGFEIKYRLYNFSTFPQVWIPNHKQILVWVIVFGFIGALRVVNFWRNHGGVVSFRVAGVFDVGLVRRALKH